MLNAVAKKIIGERVEPSRGNQDGRMAPIFCLSIFHAENFLVDLDRNFAPQFFKVFLKS